jgi:hypothetical protein
MNVISKLRLLSLKKPASFSIVKVNKRQFSVENKYHYHHDYNPEYIIPASNESYFLTLFEISRICFYVLVLLGVAVNLPTYILFRSKKYKSNPDYLLDMKKES